MRGSCIICDVGLAEVKLPQPPLKLELELISVEKLLSRKALLLLDRHLKPLDCVVLLFDSRTHLLVASSQA